MAAHNARIRKNALDKQNLKTLLKDRRREPQATPAVGLQACFPARLPEAIRRRRQILPQAEFTLKELTSHEQAEALRDGRIDVGISRVRIENRSIHREILVEEPLIAALPWDHPLAAKGDVSLEALMAGRLALYPNNSCAGFGDHILSLLQDRGLMPCDTLEVRDLQTARSLSQQEKPCVLRPTAPAFSLTLELSSDPYASPCSRP